MIAENVKRLRAEIPEHVTIIAAAKTRSPVEVLELLATGLTDIGENYVQEAREKFDTIGSKFRVRWHCIGHLQRNKVKKAVEIFDMVQTVDSFKLAVELDKRCKEAGKKLPVLIEINSGREAGKTGVLPQESMDLIKKISSLESIEIAGLMTMGPVVEDSQELRPYFESTRLLYEEIQKSLTEKVRMKYLSMGMSDSYKIAIEEGANMVRLGTAIFGERP